MSEDQVKHLSVALYCRVSTEEQREGQTIDSQIAELERFVRERQWAVIAVYKDEGWSGSLLARPALDQLRDHARQGRFQAVLVNDVDRLARDVSHLGIVKRDLEGQNVRVIFRKLPGEQSPTHNLLVNILGSFAEFERELIADRTRRGRRHKVEVRKQHVGALPPYGFKYIVKRSSDGEPGHLEILPDEAAIVRRMYGWVDRDGLSAQKVVKRLNTIGIRPRKGGARWQKSSVLRILRSEVYSGVWHYNKHLYCVPLRPSTEKYRKSLRTSLRLRPRSEWIPVPLPDELRIVDVALWHRVQQQLTRNIAMSPRNSRHNYLLKGLARCGGCQGAYVGDPDSHGFSYRCVNRCKRYPSIREGSLDGTVWKAVAASLRKPEIIMEGIQSVEQHKRNYLATNDEHDARALEQIRAEEARILQAYRLGFLTADQLGMELKALKARTSLIESHKREQTMKTDISSARRSLEEYCKAVSAHLEITSWDTKRQIMLHLLTKVTFEGDVVRICGRVPLPPGSFGEHTASVNPDSPEELRRPPTQDDAPEASVPDIAMAEYQPNAGGIANTMSWSCGRTPPDLIVTFELLTRVFWDRSAALVARRKNLLKANAVRSRGSGKKA